MLFYPSHKCKKKEFDWLGSGGTLDHLRKDRAGRLWGRGLESAISVCVCVGGEWIWVPCPSKLHVIRERTFLPRP